MASSGFKLAQSRRELRPFRLHFAARLRSTNDHAAKLRREKRLYAPAVVLTANQTAGRGRGANRWWSDRGCLTVTFVLAANERAAHEVPLIAGLAVRDAAAELCGIDEIGLKWPNDVVWGTKKLAGLLCERVDHVDLIGVGLNVNVSITRAPKALRPRLTTLAEIAGREIDINEALATVARHLHASVARRGERLFAETLRRYDGYHAIVGKRVTIMATDSQPAVAGICQGLDSSGRLVLRDRGKTHRIIAGQVSG